MHATVTAIPMQCPMDGRSEFWRVQPRRDFLHITGKPGRESPDKSCLVSFDEAILGCDHFAYYILRQFTTRRLHTEAQVHAVTQKLLAAFQQGTAVTQVLTRLTQE